MRMTDTSLTKCDKVWNAIVELKKRDDEWFRRTELHLFYDRDCISPDTVLECDIFLGNTLTRRADDGGTEKDTKIIFVAIDTKTCDGKISEMLGTHSVMQRFFATGSIFHGLDIKHILAQTAPTQQWIVDEIDKLKVDTHAYLSELGYEFADGNAISRSVIMTLPVFLQSWGL